MAFLFSLSAYIFVLNGLSSAFSPFDATLPTATSSLSWTGPGTYSKGNKHDASENGHVENKDRKHNGPTSASVTNTNAALITSSRTFARGPACELGVFFVSLLVRFLVDFAGGSLDMAARQDSFNSLRCHCSQSHGARSLPSS